jgi:predicted RNA-binding protein
MCEFKVRSGEDIVAEEILTFAYDAGGSSAVFSDVLGRKTEVPCALVTGINMLPGHHDITLLQTPAAEKAVKLALALARQGTDEYDPGQVKQLLQEITEIIESQE